MASTAASPQPAVSQPPAARVGKYLMLDILGEGAFGKVRLAVDETDGRQYAMKIMQKSHIKANELTLQVRREIAVMKAMRHPNIVNLHEVLTSSKNLYMVMDLVTGGELFDAVAEAGKLSEPRARLYFQQLVDGIHYCHTRRVYHRDLKPENLLLTADKHVIKITDFGLSSIKATNASSELLHTIMGSPHYIAPEIITSAAEGYDGSKVDVWASGIILFGMMAGFLPFDEPNNHDLYRSIVYNPIPFPPYFSNDVTNLIRDMLQKDPSKRPTMEHIKRYTWFKLDYSPALPEGTAELIPSHRRGKSRVRSKKMDRQKHKKRDSTVSNPKSMPAFRPSDEVESYENNTKIDPISSSTAAKLKAHFTTQGPAEAQRGPEQATASAEGGLVDEGAVARRSNGPDLDHGRVHGQRMLSFDSSKTQSSNYTNEATDMIARGSGAHSDSRQSPSCSDGAIDGLQVSIDTMDMADPFTYVDTPSNVKLPKNSTYPTRYPFTGAAASDCGIESSPTHNSAEMSPTSRPMLQGDAVGGAHNSMRMGGLSADSNASVQAQGGPSDSGDDRKTVLSKELTPHTTTVTQSRMNESQSHFEDNGEQMFISPVSVNPRTHFLQSSHQKEGSRTHPRQKELILGRLKVRNSQRMMSPEMKEQVEDKVEMRNAKVTSSGIFKPVQALFKPLAQTLQSAQTGGEQCMKEGKRDDENRGQGERLEWDKKDWTDSGEVFADVEGDGELMRWRADGSRVGKRVPGSSGTFEMVRGRCGDIMHLMGQRGGDSDKTSSIFGSLSSELAFKLTPSQELELKAGTTSNLMDKQPH